MNCSVLEEVDFVLEHCRKRHTWKVVIFFDDTKLAVRFLAFIFLRAQIALTESVRGSTEKNTCHRSSTTSVEKAILRFIPVLTKNLCFSCSFSNLMATSLQLDLTSDAWGHLEGKAKANIFCKSRNGRANSITANVPSCLDFYSGIKSVTYRGWWYEIIGVVFFSTYSKLPCCSILSQWSD